ncbi:MAG: hypothetical protein KatS3mg001_021 [Candidatus Pacearchaeota archaeon]|nr:MAG: hypothetical protein KatS3mg001_021 [Candidatus Pacearchaeota archaeon]
MVRVQILTTPGCTGCAKVEKMLDELGVKYTVIDVTKKPALVKKYKLMTAPGTIINGKLAFSGVPSKKALVEKLGKKFK